MLADPLVALALTAAIAHLGGFVRGVTGFGAALAITPLLTLYTPPQVVVPSIVLATAFTNLPFMYRSFRAVDLKAVIFLACGAVAGLPVGLALLTLLDPEPLKRVIGLCVIASVIALQLSRRFAIRPGRWRAASFGLVSGIVNGVSGLGGPPGVLYAVVTGMRPEVARATLMFYFGVVSALTGVMMAASGLLTTEALVGALTVAPGLLIGGYLGEIAFKRMHATHFRHATMGLLILSGLLAVVA